MENTKSATEVLEDLEKQLKEAQDRVILLTGAIQGAKFILESLEKKEQTEVPAEVKTVTESNNNSKRVKKHSN